MSGTIDGRIELHIDLAELAKVAGPEQIKAIMVGIGKVAAAAAPASPLRPEPH